MDNNAFFHRWLCFHLIRTFGSVATFFLAEDGLMIRHCDDGQCRVWRGDGQIGLTLSWVNILT